MRETNYQIMSGWLIAFEIACDTYLRATRGQRSSCLQCQQFFEIMALKTARKKGVLAILASLLAT